MKYENELRLAEYVIDYYLRNDKEPDINKDNLNPELLKKAACFVTVYVKGALRGCIGNAEATGPLYKSVINNSIYAVSLDNRFIPVGKNELKDLTVEVSVLSEPEDFIPENPEKLLKYLAENNPGVIIEKNGIRALFLPQVWEDLPLPENFLGQLCLKAGLSENDWQESCRFKIFNVSVSK